MFHEQFYRELGKYLYVIASVDGSIQEKEFKMLNRVVSAELEWITDTGADFKYREITLAKLSFYNCIRDRAGQAKLKKSFLDFLRKHASKIDMHQKKVALQLIRQMAEAHKGTNAMEAVLETDVERYLKC